MNKMRTFCEILEYDEDLENRTNSFFELIDDAGGELVSSQPLQRTFTKWEYSDQDAKDHYFPVPQTVYDMVIFYKAAEHLGSKS